MYYKLLNNPNKIPLIDPTIIYDMSEDLIENITILDISNQKTPQKTDKKYILKELPDFSNWENLISLRASRHQIKRFPELPLHIELVDLETNRIETLPSDIQKYSNIESLNLKDNNIEVIDVKLPEGIRTLNIGFNKLKFFLSKLPEEFGYLNIEFNYITDLPDYVENHGCNIITKNNEGKYANNGPSNMLSFQDMMRLHDNNNNVNIQPPGYIDEITQYQPIYIPPINTKVSKTTYSSTQTVHHHDIQESLRKSINLLINKIKSENDGTLPTYTEETLDTIYYMMLNYTYQNEKDRRKQKIKHNILYSIYYYFKPIGLPYNYRKAYDLITLWCNNNYTHAGIEYTYSQLLCYILYIIQQKTEEEKESLIEILVNEVLDSEYVCTTGKFSRLINVLNGFDDTIQIILSQNEVIGNRMIMIKKKHEKTKDIEQAKKDAIEMLAEFELPEPEVNSWVDSIDYETQVYLLSRP